MAEKTLPLDSSRLNELAEEYPTPFHLYDERAIRETVRSLLKAFEWCPGFREYYAVKAAPNPHLLKILKEEGCGGDCSSFPELLLCEKVGITGEHIMFTSNETPAYEYQKARELGAVINLDDFTHIEFLQNTVGLPELICFRLNPGPLRQSEGNAIIGNPEESKYGLNMEQLIEGYRVVKEAGVQRFGLHTMVVSNELNSSAFVETARMLLSLATRLKKELDVQLDFVNLGGGIGIPYHPDQDPVDLVEVGQGVKQVYDEFIGRDGLEPLNILMENGRMVTGPHGYLVTRAVHEKHIYRDYVGVDACMANLMRPAMYGAYHHITVVDKQQDPHDHVYDVVGSLCENNDKFAIQRSLPKIDRGDLLVIHDAGAHGHSMGFQYNGKLRSAELLLKEDGSIQQIRRAETIDDYFATLDFGAL